MHRRLQTDKEEQIHVTFLMKNLGDLKSQQSFKIGVKLTCLMKQLTDSDSRFIFF